MNISHEGMVTKLCKPGEQVRSEMTADGAHMIHMVLGIAGEAGELVDAVKKAAIYKQEVDIQNVIEELGDLEFYMEGLRQGLGITRAETISGNIRKLAKRYEGFNYSNDAAIARADKLPTLDEATGGEYPSPQLAAQYPHLVEEYHANHGASMAEAAKALKHEIDDIRNYTDV